MNRRKFSRYPEFVNKAESLLAIIEAKAVHFVSGKKLNVINDTNDNRLLELSVASRANFLITGNTNDFTMTRFKRTKIISPKEYWEDHCER